MPLSHNPQSQVRHDEKGENADLVKSHAGVMDGVKLLSLDSVKLTVHLVDPVVSQSDKEKPPEQNTHVQYRAPSQSAFQQFYGHIGLFFLCSNFSRLVALPH
jgi:hypothetical protein